MKTVFEESFEEFRGRTGGTREEWRERGNARWAALKLSPHYHDGRSCAAVGCANGMPR